ncbi:DUF4349 domain-containing protein [Gracilibacillus thailandensis]|uniref:DUF4349 domain-containing protein n=1 Tax=Gracilibacillus thailandensis TaxID=563735 RepID=A0A6N7R4T8_9BACI|nr:DUF4349 domain-containing protein [Gracilibacillus thailandensis]MRI68253.1 DUF4349 domain-containing protein [Gracilibacillus thailandensis]
MKKIISILMLIVFLSACSNDADDSSYESADSDIATSEESSQSGMSTNNSPAENKVEMEQAEEKPASEDNEESLENIEDRKIIHNAQLHLETETFDETIDFLETETANYDGYVVNSNYSNHGEETERFGRMTVRIPDDHFQDFIAIVENGDLKILNKSVSGEDVTEQYVDLTSRLKSKKVVEERLLAFIEEAEKTEDLLKISDDLADVQEDMEQLTGKINYLENQSDYATIDIELTERRVDMPSVQDESLSTWEKTKDQFLKSIQVILSIASGLFVFLVGNAPIIILFLIIGFTFYFIIRHTTKSRD